WKGASKRFTPYMSSFVKPRLKRFFRDEIMLLLAKHDLIDTVAEMISTYDSNYDNQNFNWHKNFWTVAEKYFKLEISTLNYDTCIEQSVLGLEDGFEKTTFNFQRFSPRKLHNSDKSKIFHLHGSILYGYPQTKNPNEYT